ncbi:MAG TPA: protein kinase [Gemmatimonadales bacterium]|nr:protein kinase [Gemmatimonadales bacterium]
MTIERLRASLSDRYRIERELGAGGMATVYLAHDLRHDRKVAVKVLQPELAAVIGADRFLAEIRTTANLQHPNILALFDSGAADGFLYYVMPFIEGESLRDRLVREKQLPVAEAVRVAGEVAGALEYAHRRGVIHRDIKPENILLLDGRALVADFGIALAASRAGGTRMTETGMSLGTPHYMSPEQAMGERDITAKSDVYALGCVTYEMLVGDPPFTGPTAQAVVAKVLTEKPQPPSKFRDTVPESVDEAVLTALAKLPADRFASAGEFAAALGGEVGAPGFRATRARTLTREAPRTWSARSPLPWVAVCGLLGVAAIWGWLRRGERAEAAVIRFELKPDNLALAIGGVATQVALSPDGRIIAYLGGATGGAWMIYLRNLDHLAVRAVPGTEGALNPQFSPDGRWIAFRAPDGKLKKVAVDGSTVTTICSIDISGTQAAGLTWLTDREIVFARGTYSEGRGLYRVSADGGDPRRFSQLDSASGERLQLSPLAADDGRLLLYSSTIASTTDLNIGVIPMATGKPKVFAALKGIRAVGLAGGQLIYVRGDGAIMAAPFDARRLEVGTPVQVDDSIAVPASGWDTPVALSASGTLFYQHGGAVSQLVTVDAHGQSRPILDAAQVYLHPRLSPDGRRLAYEVQGATEAQIWVTDLALHTRERITREGFNNRPEWSPDGRLLLYTSSREPNNSIWMQPSDGSADATLLYHADNPIREGMFTPDGRSVIYRADTPDSNRNVYLIPLQGEKKPVGILTTVADEKEPRVSPDSKWLAYVSNESGVEEVYVRALMPGGARLPVSSGGGGEPVWSRDGRRLYYRAGLKLLVTTVTTSPRLAVSAPEVVFDGPYATDSYHPDYDVAPDGRSFVMIRPVEQNRQLVVAVNWITELRRRLGGR